MNITVTEIKPVEKGSLKAFVTVILDGILVRDCRIVQQEGQQAWFSPPQQSYELDGVRKWKPIVEFSKELRRAIEARVLEAWQRPEPGAASRLTTVLKPQAGNRLAMKPKPYPEAGDHGGIEGGDWPRRRPAA